MRQPVIDQPLRAVERDVQRGTANGTFPGIAVKAVHCIPVFLVASCELAFFPVRRLVFLPVPRKVMVLVDRHGACVYFVCTYPHKVDYLFRQLHLTVCGQIAVWDTDCLIRIAFSRKATTRLHPDIEILTICSEAAAFLHRKHASEIIARAIFVHTIEHHAIFPGNIQQAAGTHDYLSCGYSVIIICCATYIKRNIPHCSQGSVDSHNRIHSAACTNADAAFRYDANTLLYREDIFVSAGDINLVFNRQLTCSGKGQMCFIRAATSNSQRINRASSLRLNRHRIVRQNHSVAYSGIFQLKRLAARIPLVAVCLQVSCGCISIAEIKPSAPLSRQRISRLPRSAQILAKFPG